MTCLGFAKEKKC